MRIKHKRNLNDPLKRKLENNGCTCTLPQVEALLKEAHSELGPEGNGLVLFAWACKKILDLRKELHQAYEDEDS